MLDDSRGPEWTTWFVGGEAHDRAQLRAPLGRARARTASPRSGSARTASRRELTFAELSRDVTRLAEQLVALGVEPGDRVAIFLPMSPEVAVASHAIAHIGAIQVPIFSGFAAPAVAQRLQASEAKVVITQRESSRRGKARADARDPRGGAPRVADRSSTSCSRRSSSTPCPGELPPLEVDSETPVPPDLHLRARPASRRASCTCRAASSSRSRARSPTRPTCTQGDVVHFATDMGWIMGPWTVVGVGALGGTIVFAEGAPDWPHPHRLWHDGRAGARDVARALADARARAAPARRPDAGPLVAAHVRHDRRAVEPRAVPLARSRTSAARACR